ncbi:thiamine biosynthesis protein [Thermosulfuriphilus ammonigenes]|uniref:Thiamine biosynthesis protein n=1 Tax=Thermosulfuriphilus ammonigenes TaxID=1936021 RepID=A0A6G7PXU6_9BACT|nr:thiamine biosynthesis protein [Thermosulfuriphilus ammonigenes]MBA2849444.1 tRNA U34 2-thiouridine synthase MnmA/TrmU [Thermosulfuriphilus ammonigenes]QIJ72514.1 thiamine biosynthesis protein [Thermosulfuriphilus ammonigenes]
MSEKKQIKALVLFSGGLDSLLTCKLLEKQGLEVLALRFVTPFTGYNLLQKREAYQAEMEKRYGLKVKVIDVSEEYLEILKKPRYGYGRNFNPCIDCKIFFLRRAISLLPRYGASFVATGEVLGQRPMSQRRPILRLIEKASGAEGRLLRPLSARLLPETEVEKQGLVDRSRLLALSGRSRKGQMELANQLGITDYASPAGGCLLTDPILAARLRYLFDRRAMSVNDSLLALVGRHFLLPHGSWLVVGRKQAENQRLRELRKTGDLLLRLKDIPGPLGLIRDSHSEDLPLAAAILVRYAPKARGKEARVIISGDQGAQEEILPLDLKDYDLEALRIPPSS